VTTPKRPREFYPWGKPGKGPAVVFPSPDRPRLDRNSAYAGQAPQVSLLTPGKAKKPAQPNSITRPGVYPWLFILRGVLTSRKRIPRSNFRLAHNRPRLPKKCWPKVD